MERENFDFSDLLKTIEEIKKINWKKKYYEKQIILLKKKLDERENMNPDELENLLFSLDNAKRNYKLLQKEYILQLNEVNVFEHTLQEVLIDVVANFD